MTKHKAPRSRRGSVNRRALAAGIASAAVAATVVAVATRSGGTADAQNCPGAQPTLQVAVTPELAPVVEQAAQQLGTSGRGGTCTHLQVVAEDSAVTADGMIGSARRPAAWIPDSSWWAGRVSARGVALGADRPSLADSPVVLAVSPRLASRLGAPAANNALHALLNGPAGSAALALADPERDAATALGLTGLVDAAGTGPTGRSQLAQLLRGHGRAVGSVSGRLGPAASATAAVVPTSEQAVLAYDRAAGARRIVAVYPSPTAGLDYPFLVLAANPADRAVLGQLRTVLQSPQTRSRLSGLGFRAPDGSALTAADPSVVDPAVSPPQTVSTRQVDAALRTANLLSAGTRMLAVIDISGSMGQQVPGAHDETRLDVTKLAAAQGLAGYTDDSEIGLWVFSRHITGSTDYQQLVPIGLLGLRGDGTSGRARLAAALQQMHEMPNGGTALYSTVLAAVREVRRGWDRDRVNSVVVLTDGRDDGQGGPSLAALLATLRREANPSRPVPVITVGLGGGSDTAALAAISRATGGSSFLSKDGSDAFRVLAEAVSKRTCRPNC